MGFSSMAAGLATAAAALLLRGAVADVPYFDDIQAYQTGALGWHPNQTFRSSPIVAPVLLINRFRPDKLDVDAAPYIFTAGGWDGHWGTEIYSSRDLSLVYQDYSYNSLAQAAHVWRLDGRRVYATLEGGAMRVFNQSYDQLHRLVPQGDLSGVSPDTHEAVITDDGTALLIACPPETVDLSDHGGPTDAKIANCKIQEINPDNNEVLFEFAALDYFHPYDSYMDYVDGQTWDFCHQNSVQKLSTGDYIASYRHLSAVIKVNGSSGDVDWVMGGKRNDFSDVSDRDGAGVFAYQHEARVWAGYNASGVNRFTVFDNARLDDGFCDYEATKNCSRGLEVELDEQAMTVRATAEWYHPQSLVSASRGGVQRMDGGRVFVAWGSNYGWTEYDAAGDCVLDFQRGPMALPKDDSELVVYRGWKDRWMPSPPWGPSVAAADAHVYVSWNGRLVHEWLLLTSDARDDLNSSRRAVARSPRNGFETSFDLAGHAGRYARVAGLDRNGTVLGSTAVVDVTSGETSDDASPVDASSLREDSSAVSTSKGVAVPTDVTNTQQVPTEYEDSAWRPALGESWYVIWLAGMFVAIAP